MIKREKADGVMTYDYNDFDAWGEFFNEMGMGDKIVLYAIAPLAQYHQVLAGGYVDVRNQYLRQHHR